MRFTGIWVTLACAACAQAGREPAGWALVTSAHFRVYSDAGEENARALAGGLERLHAFFVRQIGLSPPAQREVRVICFASEQEYAQYRTRRGAGAYFVGAENRDYIVLPAPRRGELRFAAHEYAHVLMHSGGWRLPEWIAEGLSDVVSTVQLRDRSSMIGGDLPERSPVLRSETWFSLPELFAFRLDGSPGSEAKTGLFYAESWALADLLLLSPAYSSRFPEFLGKLSSGVPAEAALAAVYGTGLDGILRDLRARLTRNAPGVPLPAVTAGAEVSVEALSSTATRAMLADLRFATGETELAAAMYRDLLEERPSDPEIHAALGAIALQRGDSAAAAAEWKRAIDLGITDAALCYRYATLADVRNLPARGALERAIELRPDFDDARFKLALIENNSDHPEAAVAQLRAMKEVAPARAFAWWSALANALLELNRRAEAKSAAIQAQAHAATGEERDHATQLVWLAETELTVEIEGGKFHTVRVPVGGAARNPFIEPGDRAQRVEATLREVECAENGGIRLVVDTARGALTLGIPDPTRVEIRNAGGVAFEFTCGPQEGRRVLVEYAAASLVLRGLELR
jgi:tetratricopeptide (TPR) repeat protein